MGKAEPELMILNRDYGIKWLSPQSKENNYSRE